MSFDAGNPKTNESPALFPAENHRNMSRLQTMFSEDHQFNTSPASNDGWHKIVHWVQQSGLIDPLNPSAAAPDNTGGPPIAWEQLDAYSVARPWFRDANAGNIISMGAFNEIQVNAFSVTAAEQNLVTPPDNTYGEIYYAATSSGVIGRGSYWKVGGVCFSCSLIRQISFLGAQTPGSYVFGSATPNAAIIVRLNASSGTNSGNFRILYRYI